MGAMVFDFAMVSPQLNLFITLIRNHGFYKPCFFFFFLMNHFFFHGFYHDFTMVSTNLVFFLSYLKCDELN